MFDRHKTTWEQAPVWAALLGATHTMLKKVIVRYVKKRKLSLHWSDGAATAAVALLSYLTLRYQHGREVDGA